MVKGSLGSRMGPMVKALERRYPYRGAAAQAPRSRLIRCSIGLPSFPIRSSSSTSFATSPSAPAARWSPPLLFVFLFGPWIIDLLRLKQGKGQPIRADGPQSHLVTKKGTPTMGGLMILSGLVVSTLLWANPPNPYVWIVLGVTLGFGAGRLLRRLSEGDQADPRRLFRAARGSSPRR